MRSLAAQYSRAVFLKLYIICWNKYIQKKKGLDYCLLIITFRCIRVQVFDAMDANGNHVISLAEIDKFLSEVKPVLELSFVSLPLLFNRCRLVFFFLNLFSVLRFFPTELWFTSWGRLIRRAPSSLGLARVEQPSRTNAFVQSSRRRQLR